MQTCETCKHRQITREEISRGAGYWGGCNSGKLLKTLSAVCYECEAGKAVLEFSIDFGCRFHEPYIKEGSHGRS